MTANHKRPFYVFAAVAAICSLVLVTGIRSKADSSPANHTAASETPSASHSAGPLVKPLAVAVDARMREATAGSTAGGPGDGSTFPSPSDVGTPWSTEDPGSDDEEPNHPGRGDLVGPPPSGSTDNPGGDDVGDAGDGDDGDSVETRGPDDDNDPDGEDEETGDESETTNPDDPGDEGEGEDEEPGPLDETEDPSGEGDGLDPDELPDAEPTEGQDGN